MLYRVLYSLALGCTVGNAVLDNLMSVSKVEGRSMQPTLNPDPMRKDCIFLNKIGKYNVSRGDIVVIHSPKNPKIRLVKRVVAVEGDIVKKKVTQSVQIPTGHVWVEGDNIDQSADSNQFGPVPLGLVDGKVTWIVWPLDRIQPLSKEFVRRS